MHVSKMEKDIMKWFKKGQMTVLRRNKSGCCCIIDDNDNIISACGAHQEWLEKHLELVIKNTAENK